MCAGCDISEAIFRFWVAYLASCASVKTLTGYFLPAFLGTDMSSAITIEALRKERARRADKIFLVVIVIEFLYALILAPWYETWSAALAVGIPLVILSFTCYLIYPATRLSSVVLSSLGMAFVMLHIHQAQGLIETHFGVFVLIAFIAIYRDWLPIITAAAFIAVHHVAFCYLQHHGVGVWLFRDMDDHWLRVFMHAGYVIGETIFFLVFTRAARQDVAVGDALTVTTQKMMEKDQTIDFRVQVGEDISGLKHFADFIHVLKLLLRDVQQVSNKLATSAVELDEKREYLDRRSESMQHDIHHLVDAVETLSNAVHDIADSAESAAVAVSDAYSDEASLRDVVHASQEINSQLGQASERMRNLNNACHTIDNVVAVITSIAEQTNLLALNAAIEAARAGDDGRGFAVVADEVRALAGRTRESTDEIVALIKALQQDSEETLGMLESCRHISTETEQRGLAVTDSLNKLKANLGSIAELNQSIATATQEQDQVSKRMTQNAHEVREKNAVVRQEVQTLGTISEELIMQQKRLCERMQNLILDGDLSAEWPAVK